VCAFYHIVWVYTVQVLEVSWAEFQQNLLNLSPIAVSGTGSGDTEELPVHAKSGGTSAQGISPRPSPRAGTSHARQAQPPRPSDRRGSTTPAVNMTGLDEPVQSDASRAGNAVEDLRRVHGEFLTRSLHRCFLGEKTQTVQSIMLPIFSAILQFRHKVV